MPLDPEEEERDPLPDPLEAKWCPCDVASDPTVLPLLPPPESLEIQAVPSPWVLLHEPPILSGSWCTQSRLLVW